MFRVEPAFGHVGAGFLFLTAAIVVGVGQLIVPGFSARAWIVYAELTLLGWLVVFITGIWYRLFAFFIRLHFRSRPGAPARPATELIHRPVAWASLALLAGGVLLLVAGTALGTTAVVRTGAAAMFVAASLIAGQYARLLAGR